jgi:hypothetical protein
VRSCCHDPPRLSGDAPNSYVLGTRGPTHKHQGPPGSQRMGRWGCSSGTNLAGQSGQGKSLPAPAVGGSRGPVVHQAQAMAYGGPSVASASDITGPGRAG